MDSEDELKLRREKERARKAAQRARRPKPTEPPEPSEEFVRLVITERDYRLKREYAMWRHPDLITHAYRFAHLELSADVWAAMVVLEAKHGRRCTSPTKIVNWLITRGMTHRCKRSSLRTMVYRAFEKLKRLESEPYLYDRNEVVWPPFSLSEALARSATERVVFTSSPGSSESVDATTLPSLPAVHGSSTQAR